VIHLNTSIVFKSRSFKAPVSLKVPNQQIVFPDNSKQIHRFFSGVQRFKRQYRFRIEELTVTQLVTKFLLYEPVPTAPVVRHTMALHILKSYLFHISFNILLFISLKVESKLKTSRCCGARARVCEGKYVSPCSLSSTIVPVDGYSRNLYEHYANGSQPSLLMTTDIEVSCTPNKNNVFRECWSDKSLVKGKKNITVPAC
jgi:hypothetical protein